MATYPAFTQIDPLRPSSVPLLDQVVFHSHFEGLLQPKPLAWPFPLHLTPVSSIKMKLSSLMVCVGPNTSGYLQRTGPNHTKPWLLCIG